MATAARSKPSRVLTVNQFAEISALESDLAELCAEGLLEAFQDENGITRYRPIATPIVRAA